MKTLRALFLIGALVAVGLLVRDYMSRRSTQPFGGIEPPEIAANLSAQSGAWTWEQSSADSAKVLISATGFRQSKEQGVMELTGVLLRVFHEGDGTFDRIETPEASFDINADRFRSTAETTITLGVPADDPATDDPTLTQILTKNAEFDTKAGTGWSDAETLYRFEGGRGRSVGASYDSSQKYFHMKAEAEVVRFGASPDDQTVIRAGQLYYLERDQRIDLRDGATLIRGPRTIRADEATVTLRGGAVEKVHALNAHGQEKAASRTVTFRTPVLEAFYNERQTIERITGDGRSELLSESPSGDTRALGDSIDLRYTTPDGENESVLDEAFVREDASIETTSDSGARRVASEWIRLQMRPGGQELALVETLERGRAEIRGTNAADLRTLDADRIRADYAARNAMEKLSAFGDVRLESRSADATPLRTWSHSLEAELEPESGGLRRLKQWDSFRFERDGRTGRSEEAHYAPAGGRMELSTSAKVQDASGSVSAHRITLFDGQDKIDAEGDVATVYSQAAAENQDQAAGLFASDQPVYATAIAMTSDQASGQITYDGDARLWQGANRIEADVIRIHRSEKKLQAVGAVLTHLRDEAPGAKSEPVEVRAERLDYAETDRTARYRGNVRLHRERLRVHAAAIDAQMAEDSEEQASAIETAVARGDVSILDQDAGSRGEAEHAVYTPGEELVELFGEPSSPAVAYNNQGEETRGERLTYRIGDDKLHVSGGEGRAYTFRRRGS